MIYWGIDNGAHGVKFVKLLVESDGHKVLDFGSYDRNRSLQELDRDSDGSGALAVFLADHTIGKDDRVAISLPARTTLSRFAKLPPVTEDRIPDIVHYEADQAIPFDLDTMAWYYELFPRTEDSPDTEVAIFAIHSALLNKSLAVFEEAGFESVNVAQATPQAIYNSLQHLGALDEKCLLTVDLGRDSTNMMIVSKDRIWSRSVPIGTGSFTKSLEKAFKLSTAKAEELLLNAEGSQYSRQIFQAMRPVYVELVEEIKRSVGFFVTIHRDCPVKDILILGGNSKVGGLSKYLATSLELNPLTLTLAEFLNSPEERDAQDPIYWPAFGLALQAAGLSKFKGNFLPDSPSKVQALIGWLGNIKMFGRCAAFLRGFTILEAMVVIAVTAAVTAILLAALAGAAGDELRQTQAPDDPLFVTPGYWDDVAVAPTETYAIIKVKSLPDGSVDIAAKFYPPLNTELMSANPAGHILARQILENSGTPYKIKP